VKKLFFILITISISFDIARELYVSDLDIMALNDSQAQIHWFLTLAWGISLQAAASLAIFASIWHYSRATNKLLAGSAIVLSLGFSACYAYQSYMGIQATALLGDKEFAFSKESEAVSQNITRILESEGQPLKEKVETSNFYASRIYIESEKIIDVIDINGKLVPFTPDKKTLEKRAQYMWNEATIKNLSETFTSSFYRWLAILIGSALAGLIAVSFRRRYQQ